MLIHVMSFHSNETVTRNVSLCNGYLLALCITGDGLSSETHREWQLMTDCAPSQVSNTNNRVAS